MNVKNPLIMAVAITILFVTSCHGAIIKTVMPVSAKDTTVHPMLHPDANTSYLDTAGHKITSAQFMENMKTGKYTFVPDVKDSKVISIKLEAAEQKVTVGSMAPEFSGTDLDGKTIDLKELKGKTVILNFWFTSCAPCLTEISELNDLVAKYKNDSSVVFLAVTYNNAEDVKSFLKKKEFEFDIIPGGAGIIKQYGISNYPTSMIIDKIGNVVYSLTTYDGTNAQQLDGVIGALKRM